MTRKEAIEYLRPIADSATLNNYQQALRLALDALEDVEELEEIVVQQTMKNIVLVNKVLELDNRLAMARAERDAVTKRIIELEQKKEG